jgi:hypothetical protein
MALPKFLSTAGVSLHLEAECADHRVATFINEYFARAGVKLTPNKDFHVIPGAFDGKRGLEGRVYFNATAAQVAQLTALGYRVQGPRTRGYLSSEYSYRIDRNSLFWDLIDLGHRL